MEEMKGGVGLRMKFPERVFGIVCLSAAAGLLLYWITYMTFLGNALNMRGAKIDNPYGIMISSGIIGAACLALIYLGYSDFTQYKVVKSSVGFQPKATLILQRDPRGKAVSVNYGEAETAPRITLQEMTSIPQSTLKPEKIEIVEKWYRSKSLWGFSFILALIVGSYFSIMILGYTPQEVITGSTPFVVITSKSMSPNINQGDIVILRKTEVQNVQLGEVIAFKVPSPWDSIYPSPTIHKVVEKWTENNETYFRTKGEANHDPDAWILPAENVISKPVLKIPYLGVLILFVRTLPGFLALTAIFVGCLLYMYYRRR